MRSRLLSLEITFIGQTGCYWVSDRISLAQYFSRGVWNDFCIQLVAVLRANKYNADDVVILRKDIPKPMGIVAVSNHTLTCIANPCEIGNGGCSEICTLDEYGKVKCQCSPGKIPKEGGRCVVGEIARTACTKDQFECSSGACIDYVLTCDKVRFFIVVHA